MRTDFGLNKSSTQLAIIACCLLVIVMAAGCASTTVSDRERLVTGPLPRPSNIWVYDFVATADDVPDDASVAVQYDLDDSPQSADQIATGQQLGSEIAAQLVEQIRSMGLPAARPWSDTTPQINDIVLRGYLLSVKEGSAAKRVGIGLGDGASELSAAVEGFQMTSQGLIKLGSGTVSSSGSKTPGAAVGAATLLATSNPAGLIISTGMKVYGEKSGKSTVQGRAQDTAKEIANVLKERFKEEGWID